MKKWQWKSSAVLLTGALTFGTPVSALAEVENRAAAESMSKEESHEEKIGAASEVKETDSDENKKLLPRKKWAYVRLSQKKMHFCTMPHSLN